MPNFVKGLFLSSDNHMEISVKSLYVLNYVCLLVFLSCGGILIWFWYRVIDVGLLGCVWLSSFCGSLRNILTTFLLKVL